MNTNMPPPVASLNRCVDCGGTGADRAKTLQARKTGLCDKHSYVRCWSCNGNGLAPVHPGVNNPALYLVLHHML